MKTDATTVVWITGASSGIGEALAHEYARKGATVILSARRVQELERVAASVTQLGGKSMVLPLDLTKPDSFPDAVNTVRESFGRIDILVNNAGISQRSLARDTSLDIDRKILEVDYFGQIALTKAVLPTMLEQGGGQFVILSSLSGKFGYPMRSSYSAAKHALQGFFETLYLEESKHGIRVTIASPGGVNTAISQNALTESGKTYGKTDALQMMGMSPEKCARIIVHAAHKGKFEVIVGTPIERLALMLRKLAPGLLFRSIRLKV